ncbi:MAG: GNAT family N-acetyltransferase [Anaerolineae bacterium]
MDHVTLRAFHEADVDALLDIAVAAWTPVYESFRSMLGEELFEVAFPGWQHEKRRQIASACRGEHGAVVIVVEAEGEPVGFASYYLNCRTHVGEIGNNAVHPAYQGRGIGTRLYRHVIAEMREAGMAAVKVTTGGDPSHAPARRAYEKAGFTGAIPSVTYYLDLRNDREKIH